MMKAAIGLLSATMLAGCSANYVDYDPTSASPTAQVNSAAPAQQAAPAASGAVGSARLTMPPASVTPADLNVLFWSDAQRQTRFGEMENWFPGYEVDAAPVPREFERGTEYSDELQEQMVTFMSETNAVGLMVIKDGKLRAELYSSDFTADQRWTSFSVAKSFTSTLLGAAVKDGWITSLQDPVTKYLPEMAGSAYEDVTVEQLATMTSGVRWNESYTDPNSDVAQMGAIIAADGEDAIVTQLKALPREAPAGEKFVYKTGETNLIGVLVERATGQSLAEYSKLKIVDPAGFKGPLFWMIEPAGRNIGGCCLSITLGDYARMGQFALDGASNVVPTGWFDKAGGAQVSFGDSGFGYGYQWWTYPGGNYGAQGIFGQAITIVPEQKLVVAVVSNWSTATSNEYRGDWQNLVTALATTD